MGIGTNNPQVTLEVVGSTEVGALALDDGILIPKGRVAISTSGLNAEGQMGFNPIADTGSPPRVLFLGRW